MRPRHLARSAASRKVSELGVRGVFASLFDQRPSPPKSDARTRAHSKSPATAGRNTTHKNLRKLATASSSCGELRRFSSIVVRVIKNSLSVIPSKIACQAVALCEGLEESLDIISDTAAWPLLFRGLRSPTPCHPEDKSISRRLAALLAPFRPMRDPRGYARHSRLASHHELLLRSPSNL